MKLYSNFMYFRMKFESRSSLIRSFQLFEYNEIDEYRETILNMLIASRNIYLHAQEPWKGHVFICALWNSITSDI